MTLIISGQIPPNKEQEVRETMSALHVDTPEDLFKRTYEITKQVIAAAQVDPTLITKLRIAAGRMRTKAIPHAVAKLGSD